LAELSFLERKRRAAFLAASFEGGAETGFGLRLYGGMADDCGEKQPFGWRQKN